MPALLAAGAGAARLVAPVVVAEGAVVGHVGVQGGPGQRLARLIRADPRAHRLRSAMSARVGVEEGHVGGREVLESGTTDARAMQVARAGVPAGCLSIPTRYVHSPSEMVDTGDVQNSVKLLVALLSAPVDM